MVDVSIIIVGNTSDNQRIKTMHAAINKTSIDPKYKEWLERICTALVANIKEFDETLFLENIKTLEIKTVSYEGAASQKGEYNCFENTISLCEHNVGDLSFFSFAHECIHFMSTDRRNVITKTKDERGRIACPSGFAMGYETGGVRTGYSHGINEGMTERILRKALRPPKSRTVYIFQTSCLLVLDNFIFN
ncbi:MAG: hypothetical protein FWC00_04440, partial [Firmicutes bacterium]|nr:hypothetical protein [Bacillota bacterium]